MSETTNFFKPGKLSVVLDGSAGSSGKGILSSFLWQTQRKEHTKFAVATFMENAAHTIIEDDGVEHMYQCLNSIAHLTGQYEKIYVAPGSVFATKTFLGEVRALGLGPDKVGVHPLCSIVTDIDVGYEKGTNDFEGNAKSVQESDNLKIGSTLHGVGGARARRMLRRHDAVVAKDVPELAPYICNTDEEIIDRLTEGQSGLLEIAQGYTLSLFSRFWPRTTSRNCTVGAGFDDAMIPVSFAGPLALNFRTYPIRVNSNKYLRKSDGKPLTIEEWEATPESDRTIIVGDSGGLYDDQKELTWDDISADAGYKVIECTTLTKLPRRVFTFSQELLLDAVRHNATGDDLYLSVNFMNYVDSEVAGKRSEAEVMTSKVKTWIKGNLLSRKVCSDTEKRGITVAGVIVGTGPKTFDKVLVDI